MQANLQTTNVPSLNGVLKPMLEIQQRAHFFEDEVFAIEAEKAFKALEDLHVELTSSLPTPTVEEIAEELEKSARRYYAESLDVTLNGVYGYSAQAIHALLTKGRGAS